MNRFFKFFGFSVILTMAALFSVGMAQEKESSGGGSVPGDVNYDTEVLKWLNRGSKGDSSGSSYGTRGVSNPDVLVKSILQGKSLKVDVVSRDAFKSVRESMNPLTPGQIKQLKRDYNAGKAAKEFESDNPPRMVSRVVAVDLNPGATTPVIRLGVGMVSSVLFLDSTGQPWPIVGYDLGNPRAFDIQMTSKDSPDDVRSNTLMIQPQKSYGRGNIAVMLQGLNVPVVITLIPGQRVIDYRADVQIPDHGPNAKGGGHDGLPSPSSPNLVSFLNAVPPSIAIPLEIEGANADEVQVWHIGADMYIRTSLDLLSPAFISKMNGINGRIKVFKTTIMPNILMLRDGEVVDMQIKGL
jgi:intracellular multiplication protein IcmK